MASALDVVFENDTPQGRCSGSATTSEEWRSDPLFILIFGASGDVAKRKVYPALFELWCHEGLPTTAHTVIYGFARTPYTQAQFRAHIRPFFNDLKHPSTLQKNQAKLNDFLSRCYYHSGSGYDDFEGLMEIFTSCRPYHNLLVYLALPPNMFATATLTLQDVLQRKRLGRGFVRLILEKPFGHNTQSCQALLQSLQKQQWPESALFRIDHYLGKVAVRQILQLRQTSNATVRKHFLCRNNEQIECVHIILKETIGVEGRGGYYDSYGVIRDVIQNHLLQIVSLIAMELPPTTQNEDWSAETIRDAKVQLLQCIPAVTRNDCFLGQYDGYAQDPSIRNKATGTATYACLRLWVQNATWRNVPFLLEAGKALDETLCEVRFHFRSRRCMARTAILRIQPNPGLYDNDASSTPVVSFSGMAPHSAYAQLLGDALRGDAQHFVRDDELLQAWRILDPCLRPDAKTKPETYSPGTAGPRERAAWVSTSGTFRSSL